MIDFFPHTPLIFKFVVGSVITYNWSMVLIYGSFPHVSTLTPIITYARPGFARIIIP